MKISATAHFLVNKGSCAVGPSKCFLYRFCGLKVEEMKALVKKWAELTFVLSWVGNIKRLRRMSF
jgi:hypothetical protein